MKFVIIEDRIGRLEHFTEFDLQTYKNVTVLTGRDFDKFIISMKAKNTVELDQYNCVASHRSALSNEIRDTLKEYCKINKKSLIFFSGGISSTVFKDVDFPFLHINSKDFYSLNLKLFIDNFNDKNKINLLVLQFGDRWKLSLLLNLRNNISIAQNKQLLKNKSPEIGINDSELIKRVIHLKIDSLIKPDLLNNNKLISDKTAAVLLGNEFGSISSEQIIEIKSAIEQLINEII